MCCVLQTLQEPVELWTNVVSKGHNALVSFLYFLSMLSHAVLNSDHTHFLHLCIELEQYWYWVLVSLEANVIGYWILGALLGIVLTTFMLYVQGNIWL